MSGGRFYRTVALLAVASGVTQAEVPQLYGAAALREDTSVAAITAVCAESGSGWPLSLSLHLLSLSLPHAKVSLRTGIDGIRSDRLQLPLQEAAITAPLRATELQAVFGYQPVRIQSSWQDLPVIDPDRISPETYRLDWYAIDRFRIAANGITGIGGMRHLVYGVAFEKEQLSGIRYYQATDYTSSYDYVEYRRYGKGDGTVAAQAGIGYWRDFSYREQPYTFLWLLEGSVARSREALRYNDAIVPLLLSYERDDYPYQYNVRATGTRNLDGRGQLRFIVSPRFLPVLHQTPAQYRGPVQVTWSVEQIAFSMGCVGAENYYLYVDKSNVFPDGANYYDSYSVRWGPFTGADHTFRVYGTHRALGNRAALFCRMGYRSSGQGIWQGDEKLTSWSGTADLWLGVAALWRRRVYVEAAGKGFSSRAGLYYYTSRTGNRFDADAKFDVARGAEVAMSIRLLW